MSEKEDPNQNRNSTMATPTQSPFSFSGSPTEDIKTFVNFINQINTVNNFYDQQAVYLLRLSLKNNAAFMVRTIPPKISYQLTIQGIFSRFSQQDRSIFLYKKTFKRNG